jgi:hypothetical protein
MRKKRVRVLTEKEKRDLVKANPPGYKEGKEHKFVDYEDGCEARLYEETRMLESMGVKEKLGYWKKRRENNKS